MEKNNLLKKLADMVELEQIRAEAISDKIDNLSAGQKALALGDRDRHIARSRAFLDVARLVQEMPKF